MKTASSRRSPSSSKIPVLKRKSSKINSKIKDEKERREPKIESSIIYMSDSKIEDDEEKDLKELEKLQKECKSLEKYLRKIRKQTSENQEAFRVEMSIYESKIKSLMVNSSRKKTYSIFQGDESIISADCAPSNSGNQLPSLSSLITGSAVADVSEMDEVSFEKAMNKKKYALEEKKKQMKIELEKQRLEDVSKANIEMSTAIQEVEMQNTTEMEQLKEYYTKITQDNLQKIQELKTQIAKLKPEDKIQAKTIKEYDQQKKNIEESFKELQQETEELENQLEEAKLRREELEKLQKKIEILEDEKENEMIAQEVLSKRFLQLEEERDDVYNKFEATIKDVRQRTEFRGFILDQKIKEMNEKLDQKERVLRSQVTKNRLEGTDISQSIDDALLDKNAYIQQLEDKLRQMHGSYEKMIDMYEAKMDKFGIPKDKR